MKVWLRSTGSQGCEDVQRGPDAKPELFLGLGPQSECRPPPHTSMSQTAFPPTLQLLSGSQNLPKQGKECGRNSLSVKQFFVVRSRWRWRENLQAPFFSCFSPQIGIGPLLCAKSASPQLGRKKGSLTEKRVPSGREGEMGFEPEGCSPSNMGPTSGLPLWF